MHRVLLVDDDQHTLNTNEKYLLRKGYEVFLAETAEDALRIASSAALDAVVLDVDLPGADGLSVCRRIREVSRVPIIFLPAYSKSDDRVKGLLEGGDDYLGKPYSLEELELRTRLRIEGRLRVERAGILRFGQLEVDLGLREVRFEDTTLCPLPQRMGPSPFPSRGTAGWLSCLWPTRAAASLLRICPVYLRGVSAAGRTRAARGWACSLSGRPLWSTAGRQRPLPSLERKHLYT